MDCSTCIHYVDVAGLYKDSPRGLCMAPGKTPKPVNPQDGVNCLDWRPKDTDSIAKSGTYPIPPKPISFQQQATQENAIVPNDILRITYKGEWVVSAIGKMAILATNPQTNEEMAFPGNKFDFTRIRK